MIRQGIFAGWNLAGRLPIAALCLAAVPAFTQTGIDTAFARKLYSAGHDDVFKVEATLKNTAYWLLNDSVKSDRPIACDASRRDCSPAAFRLVEVIDTAKTDAFFGRHETKAYADATTFLSKPPAYARKYVLYISPTEVLFFMRDALVERLVDLDLEAAKPVAISKRGRRVGEGYAASAARRMGPWLLGRRIGPRPQGPADLP